MSETTEAAPRVDQPLIPPFLPRMIHRLALPIVLIWLGIVFVTNTISPQLEVVSKNHSVSQSPRDAVSFQSMMRVGSTFKEFSSDSSAMILLEGDKPLGAEAHRYYDEIVKRLEQDKKHVQHIQDFWSDPADRRGLPEPRPKGRVRPGLPRRQHGQRPVRRIHGCRPQDRGLGARAAGDQGLRHRGGSAVCRPVPCGSERRRC